MTAVAPQPIATRPYPTRTAVKGSFLLRIFRTTDHKQIGIMYLVTSFAFFMVGGAMAMLMRTELARPGMQFLSQEQFNQLFTMHGTVMLLLYATLIVFGFANFVLPLQIGSPDDALLKAVMLKHFADRQLDVDPKVLDYLALHIDRSLEAASRAVEAIDKAIQDYAALGLKVSITELDVTIRGAAGGQFGPGRPRGPVTPPSPEDLKAQAEQTFANLEVALKAAGATFRDVVKMNLYVVGLKPELVPLIREVRARHVNPENPPASTLVGVSGLVGADWLIEIEVVAVVAD